MITIKSNKIRWAISAVLAVLILFGTYHNIFSLAALAICGLMLIFADRESILLQMFFIMPMANIFKLSPGSQSFFTIFLLVYVVLHLVLPRKATLLVVLFAVYILVAELFFESFNLFRTIKFICNVLFLSSILNSQVAIRAKEIFMSYIVGNIVASVWGLMNSSTFKIDSYIGAKEVSGTIAGEESVIRFAGLYVDPNYYNIGLIISLCLIVILYHRREIKPVFAALMTVPIIYFLLITYSKSALFMMVIPLLAFMYSLIKNKKYASLGAVFLAVFGVFALAFSGLIPALDIVMARIEASETTTGTDINALTTGRFNLWMSYINFLINNTKLALFGSGINAQLLNARASHNTYLDVLYHLGILGGALLLSLLMAISKQSINVKIKRNLLNYSVIICVLVMYFFLSELFYFDPPFHIFLAFLVLNLPQDSSEKIYNFKKDSV